MRLLITGGAGFVGSRLARTLLAKGELNGQKIERLILADQFPAPTDLAADPRVSVKTGPLLTHCKELETEEVDGVFHLASAVSGEMPCASEQKAVPSPRAWCFQVLLLCLVLMMRIRCLPSLLTTPCQHLKRLTVFKNIFVNI
jgi:hypothetical protein